MSELAFLGAGPGKAERMRDIELAEANMRIREGAYPGFRDLCSRYPSWHPGEVWAAVNFDLANPASILDACLPDVLTPSQLVALLRVADPKPQEPLAEMLKSLANELKAAAVPVQHMTVTRAQRRATKQLPTKRRAHRCR